MFLCLTADACGQRVKRDKQRKEMEKHNQFTMRNLDTFLEQKVMQYHLTKVEYKILYYEKHIFSNVPPQNGTIWRKT